MKTLSREQILKTVEAIPNGRIARVTYKTELPVKAEFKKQGYVVTKLVETTGRFGVQYHHIASVIARKAEEGFKEAVKRTNNYVWVINNKVKHNTVTDKDYIVLASFNGGHHTKSKYIVSYLGKDTVYSDHEFKYSDNKNLVIDSYWKPSKNAGEVKNISFENVLAINNVGTKINF